MAVKVKSLATHGGPRRVFTFYTQRDALRFKAERDLALLALTEDFSGMCEWEEAMEFATLEIRWENEYLAANPEVTREWPAVRFSYKV